MKKSGYAKQKDFGVMSIAFIFLVQKPNIQKKAPHPSPQVWEYVNKKAQ
jgi:hypothetical protein